MKNPEYLSILDKKAIKNGKIDDKTQVEQVSVMNKLLNDALRAKGYAGPDIKMVLTDVEDPNGPYYTDTLTNVVVFDRKILASANRDEILNALGHEFGHYSKEDDIDKSQDIANHTGKLLEDRIKGMVAKEATENTLARIRNNPNVITGEEGKKLAENIPMERREYYKVFIVKGTVSKVAAGVEVDGGVIYNKDPITGEEEFGYVLGGQGIIGIDYGKEDITNVGKILTRYDWDLASYEDKGKPIKDFQGFIGGVDVKINLFGYQFNWGISIGGNKGDFYGDVNVTDGRIKVGGSGGYIHVIKLDNPSEAHKIFIRGLANNSEKIVDIKNIIFKIKDIIDGREELKKW